MRMITRRDAIKTLGLGIGYTIVPNAFAKDTVSYNDTLEHCIEDWAERHAIEYVTCDFTQQTFQNIAGESYHAIPPVNFVKLPMNDGTMSKYIVEFPADVRREKASNENYDGWKIPKWKVNLARKVKSWLKHEAINRYSKLPNVDFTQIQLKENA